MKRFSWLALIIVGLCPIWVGDPPLPRQSGRSVVRHFASQSWQGLNIVNTWSDRAECLIMDMDGAVLADVPGGFCQFLSSGELATFIGSSVFLMDPIGTKWTRPADLHHVMTTDPLGHEVYYLDREDSIRFGKKLHHDVIVGFNRQGEQIFRWSTKDHLDEIGKLNGHVPPSVQNHPKRGKLWDYTHFNSLQILGPNSVQEKIAAFKPGNFLVGCATSSHVYIIDRESQKVIWAATPFKDVAGFHTARLLPNGNILVFVNRHPGLTEDGEVSSVVEFDPVTRDIIWSYIPEPKNAFFSKIYGSAQRLPNGNTLITSGAPGGWAFEINLAGKLVWSWRNPKTDSATGLPRQTYSVTRVPRSAIPDWVFKMGW